MKLVATFGIALVVATLGGAATASTSDWHYDVYVVGSDGSRPTRLTTDAVTEMSPAVSPNGRQIAYLRGTRVGTPETDLWIMNADGSGQRPLVATSDIETEPAWSPDGRWIAFTSIACDERFCMSWRVLRVRPDGTGLSQLFTDGRRPLWSRDGRRLLIEAFIDPYYAGQSLVVLPSNGGSSNQVVDERPHSANWSADGKSIGFSTYDYDRDEQRAWILDVRTERKQALEKYGRVLFSPRGSRMLAEAKTGGVFVLTPGRRAVRLPRGSFHSWSPKGARLAYEFKHDLYVIGADGRSRRRVLRFPRGLSQLPPYVWSPNGRRIYYTRATPSS